MTRLATRALSAALFLCVSTSVAVAQAPETFNGCFVPSVGAFYLIKRAGLPAACVATGHLEVTWTGSGAPADGSITAVKLADGSVVTIKIADGAVSGAKLADASVTSAKIAGAAVGSAQIADGAVVAAKLGADVGAAVLGTGSVTTAKIADGAVVFAKLGADVAPGILAINAITTAKLADGAVTQAKLADGAVSTAKMAPGTSVDALGGVAASGYALAAHDHSAGDVSNTAVGSGALPVATGTNNTALGAGAMNANTTGTHNTAIGTGALASNTIALSNTAVGNEALWSNDGGLNTAVGSLALRLNTTGSANTAVGRYAMGNGASGTFNTALGHGALYNSTGDYNVAIGTSAGANATTGGSNIHILNNGLAGDANVIRIGTVGSQTKNYQAGIYGVTTDNFPAIQVYVANNGQMGTVSSSRRFKEDIQDMSDRSRRLFDLRPVAFRYKQTRNDGMRPPEYGLVAEEVAQALPELAVMDSTGQAETVRYDILPVLLLNELKRLSQRVDSLEAVLAKQGK